MSTANTANTSTASTASSADGNLETESRPQTGAADGDLETENRPAGNRFDRARKIADAVLFEGYALYPYRASSTKNQLRWQFGVLAPRAFCEAGGAEAWWMETQCLVRAATKDALRLEGRLRFLRLRRRRVEVARDASGAPPEGLDVEGRLLVPWDEGEVREIDFAHRAQDAEQIIQIQLPSDEQTEDVREGTGELAARVTHRRASIEGALRIRLQPIAAAPPPPDGGVAMRLCVRIENHTPMLDARASRDEALLVSLLSTHLLLGLSDGEFVSQIDPPEWASAAVAACRNARMFPVLAGEEGQRDLVLSSPIILYDHPAVAPESPGDLFDATEIDEILTLRTMMLTDDEKRQARGTDPRVAALIDRVDGIGSASPQTLERLHGVIRGLRWMSDDAPAPDRGLPDPALPLPVDDARVGAHETLLIGTTLLARGSRVLLRPGARRTDAQDMFLAGRIAVVEAVMRDVEDRDCLAVLVEDDPAAELHRVHGRFLYFYPDEVELLPPDEAAPRAPGSAPEPA